jgi:type VI secretion system protein ImpH
MATPRRRPDPPLDEELFKTPYRFDFLQAVRLLQRASGEVEPVGRAGPPRKEAVRFRVHQSLAFPPSEIQALEPSNDPARPPLMTVAFLGLTGPTGVLPQCYTELMIERNRAGDRTAAAFFDLFNHRLISLFYRAWEK